MQFHIDAEPNEDVVQADVDFLVVHRGSDDLEEHQDESRLLP